MARKTRNSTVRGAAQKTTEAASAAAPAPTSPPKPSMVISDRDKQIRQRALALLRGETLPPPVAAAAATTGDDVDNSDNDNTKTTVELPILYAALKRIKEIQKFGAVVEDDSDLTEADASLLSDASLAVPYLLYKRLCEQFMLPRNMGGMALSDANSKQLTSTLFRAMGPSCCSQSMTEQRVAQKCPELVKKKTMDTRTLVLSLKCVGQEARSQLEHVEELLTRGLDVEEQDGGTRGAGAAAEEATRKEAKLEEEDKEKKDPVSADKQQEDSEKKKADQQTTAANSDEGATTAAAPMETETATAAEGAADPMEVVQQVQL